MKRKFSDTSLHAAEVSDSAKRLPSSNLMTNVQSNSSLAPSGIDATSVTTSNVSKSIQHPQHNTQGQLRVTDHSVSSMLATTASDWTPFDEPAVGPLTTRLQLLLRGGVKRVRRFNKADTIAYLYKFIKHLYAEEDKGQQHVIAAHDFVIVNNYPKRQVPNSLKTLEEEGILNSTLIVEDL
jgi:hypothetical protein